APRAVRRSPRRLPTRRDRPRGSNADAPARQPARPRAASQRHPLLRPRPSEPPLRRTSLRQDLVIQQWIRSRRRRTRDDAVRQGPSPATARQPTLGRWHELRWVLAFTPSRGQLRPRDPIAQSLESLGRIPAARWSGLPLTARVAQSIERLPDPPFSRRSCVPTRL